MFFFFQAEDGIRDYKVTGVQTCALPIWSTAPAPAAPMTASQSRRESESPVPCIVASQGKRQQQYCRRRAPASRRLSCLDAAGEPYSIQRCYVTTTGGPL